MARTQDELSFVAMLEALEKASELCELQAISERLRDYFQVVILFITGSAAQAHNMAAELIVPNGSRAILNGIISEQILLFWAAISAFTP